jgi:uncharacterized membrane protein (DUF485 family)
MDPHVSIGSILVGLLAIVTGVIVAGVLAWRAWRRRRRNR